MSINKSKENTLINIYIICLSDKIILAVRQTLRGRTTAQTRLRDLNIVTIIPSQDSRANLYQLYYVYENMLQYRRAFDDIAECMYL